MRTTSSLVILFTAMTCLYCPVTNAQTVESETADIHEAIIKESRRIHDSLVDIRRDIHRHPEIAGQEERTSGLIQEYLTNLGLEVKTGIGGHGVIGILRSGRPGKAVAWRADIDALETDFPDVVEFRSEKEGIRHICGHDVHTVIAMGIANVLSGQRDLLNGTVYFLFQPAEENIQGAKAMIDDGAMELMDADEIYALHMTPFPVGTFATKKGQMYGDFKRIEIVLEKSADSAKMVDFVKDRISALDDVGSPERFNDPMAMGDPEVGIAGPKTIFGNYVAPAPNFYVDPVGDGLKVTAHISTSEIGRTEQAKETLRENLEQSRYVENLRSVDFLPVTYSPFNDGELVDSTLEAITEIYGNESFVPLYGVIPGGTGDDFALFQESVPGVYFFLGGSNFEEGKIAMPHTPEFAVDESCIEFGVNYFSSMIVERLKSK